MPITLPKQPDGDQYEDFVAACLLALGYFTETRLVLRDRQKEVLELDIVATPLGDGIDSQELFEAKREGISFPNIFKLFGQRQYLQIPNACLVSLKGAAANHLPVYTARGAEMGIRLSHLPPNPSASANLAIARNWLSDEERAAIVGTAWYQHVAKRLAFAEFNRVAAAENAPAVCVRIKDYLFGIYAAFFQRSPLARAEALYSAWMATPRLAGEAVATVAGQEGRTEAAIWNAVNDDHFHVWVQMIMHLETTARLRIVKNALDDFITRGAAPPPTTVLTIGSLSLDVPLHALPVSFHEGLEALRNHQHARKLPYLFQIFAELLGGFLVFGNERELAFVERLTGVPAADIPEAIRLLDYFFAPAGGTMFYTQGGEILCLKMIPGYVHGGGAFLRQAIHGIDDYSSVCPRMGWLLARWHNAIYHVLEPHLEVRNA